MSTGRDKTHISRKIYFYKIYAGNNGVGSPIPYNVKSVLEAIDKLSFQTASRYLKDEDGIDFCCWVDDFNAPLKLRFGKIKRDDFPRVEHKGKLSDLSIPEESGLAECVHLMVFPDNIVGIEYNSDGPRIGSISTYLHVKSQNVCSQIPVFEQLLHPDVLEKLDHMRTIRQFVLKVRPSLFSSHQQADEYLAKSLQAAQELGKAKEIELKLSAGRGRESLDKKLLGVAKRLFALRDTSNDVIKGEIKGYNEEGNIEVIDLLSTKIFAQKWIPRYSTGAKGPQSEFVYAAINEAYNELKDQLLVAAGVTLCTV